MTRVHPQFTRPSCSRRQVVEVCSINRPKKSGQGVGSLPVVSKTATGGLLDPAGGLRRAASAGRRPGDRCRVVLLALLSALLGAACAPTVRLDTEFPSPAVEPLPLHAAVSYSEEFESYTYDPRRGVDEAIVELGPAQVRLLDRMFDAMFAQFSRQDAAPDGGNLSAADVVISPSIERFTLKGPNYLGSGYYEVRIAYRLDFHAPTGELVGELPVEGYGRSSARWNSLTEPVREATIRAMRDAAVQIVIKLAEQPAIDQLIRETPAPEHGRNAS